MISYFLEPFTATHKENGHELLVLGLYPDMVLRAICITDEGELLVYDADLLDMNIRYDDRKNEWVDTKVPAEKGDDDGEA